jgi:hypothetical protein
VAGDFTVLHKMEKQFDLAAFEVVDGALDDFLRAGDFLTCGDPVGWIRKSNVLLDACVDAGMDYEHDDHVGWATAYVVDALVSA